jgi:hypothetical protein
MTLNGDKFAVTPSPTLKSAKIQGVLKKRPAEVAVAGH